jgi:hypothetical protein
MAALGAARIAAEQAKPAARIRDVTVRPGRETRVLRDMESSSGVG